MNQEDIERDLQKLAELRKLFFNPPQIAEPGIMCAVALCIMCIICIIIILSVLLIQAIHNL